MTHCRACSEACLHYLWQDNQGGHWFRCLACGCDSSSNSYAETKNLYTADYLQQHHGGLTIDEEMLSLRSNLDWFEDYKTDIEGRDFLDVGCCRGVAMMGMQQRGWSVHGFDVIPESAQPGCSTIAPQFQASLFPQKYHAVMCREVIEHVDHPMQMLTELANVTNKKGYLQLQTPRPTDPTAKDEKGIATNGIGYQAAHICILSPQWVKYWLERLGFEIKDYRLWDLGQCWMAKRL